MITSKGWPSKVFAYVFQDYWLQAPWCQDPCLWGVSDLWRTFIPSPLFHQAVDGQGDIYTITPSSVKIPDPSKRWMTLILLFLSVSPRCCLCQLSKYSINSAPTSCWFMFDFHPLQSEGPSWPEPWNPSGSSSKACLHHQHFSHKGNETLKVYFNWSIVFCNIVCEWIYVGWLFGNVMGVRYWDLFNW